VVAQQDRLSVIPVDQGIGAYALITPMIEKLRAKGLSMKAIAEKLNDDGYKTPTGSTWTAMQIKRILDRSTIGP
jgi:hypothetical protein